MYEDDYAPRDGIDYYSEDDTLNYPPYEFETLHFVVDQPPPKRNKRTLRRLNLECERVYEVHLEDRNDYQVESYVCSCHSPHNCEIHDVKLSEKRHTILAEQEDDYVVKYDSR